VLLEAMSPESGQTALPSNRASSANDDEEFRGTVREKQREKDYLLPRGFIYAFSMGEGKRGREELFGHK